MSHGALATLKEDGTPLATYSSYILEDNGQPLLRLRADAVHKANLERNAKCSLFVQPQDFPARNLARVTLIGQVVSYLPAQCCCRSGPEDAARRVHKIR